jgi:hypothetical protein
MLNCVAGGETVFPLSVHRQSVEEAKKHSGEMPNVIYSRITCYPALQGRQQRGQAAQYNSQDFAEGWRGCTAHTMLLPYRPFH